MTRRATKAAAGRSPWSALPRGRVWLATLGALLLAGPLAGTLRADEARGIVHARKARKALAAGDTTEAARRLGLARVEWPDAPLLDVLAGDVAAADASWSVALDAYGQALDGGVDAAPGHHSHFNRAVSAATQAEAALSEAGVPLHRNALPEGAPPAPLIQAIQENLPRLEGARDDFLAALDLSAEALGGGAAAREGDAAARESIAALDDRMDELRAMLEDLERQQSEDGEQGDQGTPQENDEDSKGPSQPEGQNQDDQQPGEPEEPPQDQPPEEPEESPQADEPLDEGDPPQARDAPAGEPRDLTPEEMQRLIETLQKLEDRARQIDRMRAAGKRRTPEKDW